MKQVVETSFLPNLLSKNGDYSEPFPELLHHLNFDYRLKPSLLRAVANLRRGSIVVDKEVIFVMVAEVYGRGKASDTHAETNLKSLPTPASSFYGSLSIGIHEEANSGTIKRKLKIVSRSMNVLVTMSCCLKSQQSLNIGPETASTLQQVKPLTARIFYCDSEIKQFLNAMSDNTFTVPKSLTSLRQLTSGFGDSTTYLPFRAAHEELNDDLMVPATVFTLCDMPHNQGYGTSSKSTGN